MSFEIPDDRTYAETHEWALRTDGTVRTIGDFTQGGRR
jgi:glycine cleavage system H lipoate-binding protein